MWRTGRKCASGGGRTTRLRRLVLLVVVTAAWRPGSRVAQAACGALEGILSDDWTTCCLEACGLCGGLGCMEVEGVEDTDCCVTDIAASGRTCGVDGTAAPCTIDPDIFPLASPAPTAASTRGVAAPTATPAGTAPTAAAGTAEPTVSHSVTFSPFSVTAASLVPPTAAPVAARSAAPVQASPPGSTTLSPVPEPTATAGPQALSTGTPAPTSSPGGSAPDSTLIVVGVISAVGSATLIALAVWCKRRRVAKQRKTARLPLPPIHDGDNLEQGRDQSRHLQPPSYAAAVALVSGNGGDKSASHQRNASPHRLRLAEANGIDVSTTVPPSKPLPVKPNTEHAAKAAEDKDWGAGLAREEDAAGFSARDLPAPSSSIATASMANVSTHQRAEPAEFLLQRQGIGSAACVAGGPPQPGEASGGGGGGARSSSAPDRKNSAGDIGLGHAVLAAAQELAHRCQIPGVSEAATAVCLMANLVADSRENARASDSRLRLCRSIVMAIQRAAKVASKGGDTIGEVARALIEDVHDAIFDLVELIKTYQSKNKLSRLFMSTLFKRRQEELDAVVDRAIMRLQLGLQLQVGHDVSAVKDDVSAVKDSFKSMKEDMLLYQRSLSEAASESVAEARRTRRRRKLDQVEIPEEHLSITDELLGKGGFGEVYLADYNGHNAAAKVLHITHGLGALEDNSQRQGRTSLRRAFLRELEAMIRLRSDNTVNVYGAVTSLPDRMVLVMELLSGGDLLTFLRKSEKPLPEEQSRRIIRDICTGMAFLHSKDIHGDLKSANVLLGGGGRAKIADFGTSRWSQHTDSTGLATYTTKANQTTQMSVAWSAPEVLDSEGSSYASDVYSFGVVVWEVISRKLPWSDKTRPSEIMLAVLRGTRPSFHIDAPADVVAVAKACWAGEPKQRPKFRAILVGMKAKGCLHEQAQHRAH